LLNLFLVYQSKQLKSRNAELSVFINTTKENLKSKLGELNEVNQSVLGNLSINNIKINTDSIVLLNRLNSYISLKKILKEENKLLIYRIPNETCDPCVSRVINEIRKKKNYNNKLILLVSNKIQLKEEEFDMSEIGIETYFLSESLPFNIEYQNKDYFFSIDIKENTSDGYIPFESNSFFIENYIGKIVDNYEN